MSDLEGDWFALVIVWSLMHILVNGIAGFISIELRDWAPPCRDVVCVS